MFFRKRTNLDRTSVRTGKSIRQEEIPADAVRIGMRVIKLDRPWAEVPFLFQQVVIDDADQLALLRQHCLSVTVELTQDEYRLVQASAPHHGALKQEALAETESFRNELPRARARYEDAHRYVENLLGTIESGQEFNLDGAHAVVESCVVSILANANAMFWLSRIRDEDAYTAEHCLRVGILAIAFGRFLGLPQEDLQTLGLCGMLHDIGKVKIPPEVLNKPGALTPEEWQLMKTHPQHGFDLLGSHHQLEPVVRDAALSHHERIDGNGYPNGIAGPSISRTARMIAIVDAYDAITSDRCYRKGKPTVEALRILYQDSGKHFDASLVEQFIRMIGLYPPGSLVKMRSGEIAMVLSTKPDRKLQPIVELVLDRDGQPCEPVVINLAEEPRDSAGIRYSIAQALPDGAAGFNMDEHIRRHGGQVNEAGR